MGRARSRTIGEGGGYMRLNGDEGGDGDETA